MKYGKLEILLGAIRRPDLVLRYLKGKQPSEFDLEEVARLITNKEPIVVEAGAFDGRDTRAFAELWPNGKIFAFEPLPVLARRVKAATEGLQNVTVLEKAFGTNNNQIVDLYSFDEDDEVHGSSSILPPEDHLNIAPEIKFGRKVSVPSITINDWHKSIGSPIIDLLWLDLQGAELMVLEHGRELISKTRVCHIEVSKKPLYEGGATFKEVKVFFAANGFTMKSSRIPVRSGNAIFILILTGHSR